MLILPDVFSGKEGLLLAVRTRFYINCGHKILLRVVKMFGEKGAMRFTSCALSQAKSV
jgi:hypothetical protein